MSKGCIQRFKVYLVNSRTGEWMISSDLTQLGLGTVQLGLPYGNAAGSPLMPKDQSFLILETALAGGIRFFDTAIAYGESETRIGAFDLVKKCPQANISTKFPPVSSDIWRDEAVYWEWLLGQLEGSKQRLNINKHGLLQFHQCDIEFLSSLSVQRSMQRLLSEKYCSKIGISVYTPEQAYAALAIPEVSSLQVPVNLIDRRFLEVKFLTEVKKRRVSLIGRSIFLQGVLIEGAQFPPVKQVEALKRLRLMTAKAVESVGGLQNAAFRFVCGNFKGNIQTLLIGVDSPSSLMQNLTLFEKSTEPIPERVVEALDEARVFAEDRNLLHPGHWND